MKLFTADQIRAWDKYTIEHEPIASHLLMERAAEKCVHWLFANIPHSKKYHIICGKGNNGGDGLVIAKILNMMNFSVELYIVEHATNASPDFEFWFKDLSKNIAVKHISDNNANWPIFDKDAILIDAIFGSGLSTPLEGWIADFIIHLNKQKANKISIDIPSGLPADLCDTSLYKGAIIKADITLTFQIPKLSFLLPDTGNFANHFEVLDIGLDKVYEKEIATNYHYITISDIKPIIKHHQKFEHKGTRGHALLICGSLGMTGAAILSAKSCLLSGAGLCSVHLPDTERLALHAALPEALWLEMLDSNIEKYNSIACGCGIGQHEYATTLVDWALQQNIPTVFDADALNIIAQQHWLKRLTPNTIITPHVKEFERLCNSNSPRRTTGKQRLELQIQMAKGYHIIIVLKGAHTSIALPDGTIYFNSTGNPILATGGSGDVLTGMIAANLTQGYTPSDAAMAAVFTHGLAADELAKEKEYILSGEVAEKIPYVLKRLL
ncbi:MAG: NAD(P)H-hydrate dehydratase [Bacteroidota bacterium]|nr:NAD(P)H-hydrate dehydratase [Bacteroidota bacterium]